MLALLAKPLQHCTTEGQDFRDNHQAFLDANTIIYGVSKDDLTKHEKFKTKQAFPFELIADVEGDYIFL
jgi:peroxiredoxin Q/BCP